jgi:hypothetical protein
LASALEERFRLLGRPVPMVRVISVVGIPPNERAYKEFVAQLKQHKQNPLTLGLPSRLRDSQFFDGTTKSIVPSCFIYASTLGEIGDTIYVITINTDYHGEIKCRGIHSGVATVLSMAEVVSAHASAAILASSGSVTLFMGTSGAGKSLGATFWTERNDPTRRNELLRRQQIEKGNEKAAKDALKGIGFLCQDDWIHIVPSGRGQWDVWPSERQFYMRTRDLLSRDLILSENEPIIENATADYGAAGARDALGRSTHGFPDERMFYDPDWDNYYADRDVHRIAALILLERDTEIDYAIRRIQPKEALDTIVKGGVSGGESSLPFYTDYTDVSGLLMSQAVVGDRLIDSYKAALSGDVAALMNGDEALGRVVLDRMKTQLEIWKLVLADVPTFVVNTVHGRDLTQDLCWYASEFPDFLKPGAEKTVAEFRKLIEQKLKVRYDDEGNWVSGD